MPGRILEAHRAAQTCTGALRCEACPGGRPNCCRCHRARSMRRVRFSDVLRKVLLAGGGELVPGHRSPLAVGLVDRQVAGVLQLAQVGAQAAVLLFQHLLQPAERHRVVLGQQHADGQPDAVLQEAVQRRQFVQVGNVADQRAWSLPSDARGLEPANVRHRVPVPRGSPARRAPPPPGRRPASTGTPVRTTSPGSTLRARRRPPAIRRSRYHARVEVGQGQQQHHERAERRPRQVAGSQPGRRRAQRLP